METNNYQRFIFDETNRLVTKVKVEKLKKSMQVHGYINSHRVLVFPEEDGNLMVIDGQHRVKACESLKIPVPYENYSGTRDQALKAMIDLNNTGTNWSTEAWVNHYAARGNEVYEKVQLINENYKFGITNILSLVTNHRKGGANVKEGNLKLLERWNISINLVLATHIKERINFNLDRNICDAIAIMVSNDSVQNKDLERFRTNTQMIEKCGSVRQYCKLFEKMLNYYKKGKRIFLVSE